MPNCILSTCGTLLKLLIALPIIAIQLHIRKQNAVYQHSFTPVDDRLDFSDVGARVAVDAQISANEAIAVGQGSAGLTI